MESFFNKYEHDLTAGFSQILSIPETNQVFVFGRKDTKGMIFCLDENGKQLWERLYEVPGRSCFFVQGMKIDSDSILVLGSILTDSTNRRRHLLVKITHKGDIQLAKEIYDSSTRNSIRLLQTGIREFMLTGWSSNGPDRIGMERVNINGELQGAQFLHLGADDQFYDVAQFEDHLLFVGGTNKGGGGKWDGFMIRSDIRKNKLTGHLVSIRNTNIIEEIDAVIYTGRNKFIIAGHTPNDIFVTAGHYIGENLTLESLRFANLNAPSKVRKIVQKNQFVYVLGHNPTTLKHFVIKYDLEKTNFNLSKIWIKTFNIEDTCYLTDLIPQGDGFFLCGLIRDKLNKDTPIFIKTDGELKCCLTEEIVTNVVDTPVSSLDAQSLSPIIGDLGSKSYSLDIRTESPGSKAKALCPPLPDKGKCPFAMVGWNALEPRARSKNIDRALQAEIRDAMWMLSRQWQWGEFDGEDGGSIVHSKVNLRETYLTKYTQLVNTPLYKPFNNEIPLEYLVEKTEIDFSKDLLLRLEIGDFWNKLLQVKLESKAPVYKQGFIQTYPFTLPVEPNPNDNNYQQDFINYARIIANEEAWAVLNLAQGRSLDGHLVYQAILNNSIFNHNFINPSHNIKLQEVRDEFMAWIQKKYSNPVDSDSAWAPNNIEYQFQCEAPNTEGITPFKFIGKEYPGGNLDWYAVDTANSIDNINNDNTAVFNDGVTNAQVNVLIPSKLSFPGMPSSRWWEMEDSQVDFGNMLINTTDISKLLLLDFMINYANNWYIIPHQADVGSLTEIPGIEVKDNFGIRTLIIPANKIDHSTAGGHRRWAVFQIEDDPNNALPDSLLFLPPAVPNILESKQIEKVNFIRDEMANMVWGIEQTIPNQLSGGRDGHEASIALTSLLTKKTEEEAALDNEQNTGGNPSSIKYKLATSVQENWIPFIPVHTGSNIRSIQLQRATMPRNIEGFETNITPETNLLKTHPTPYYIHEEEVPKVGQIVSSSWQRARWFGGKTFVWYGNKKQVGRSGGTSGLKFDQIKTSP